MLGREPRGIGHGRHRLGQTLERCRQGGNAAAVDPVREIVGLQAAQVAHHRTQPLLHRMVVLDVALGRLAVGHRCRQEATVLARAVVVGGGRQLVLAGQRLDRRLQARRMGAAFEIGFAQAHFLQPGAHRLDMARLAAVRSAGERDMFVAEPETLDGAAFHEGHGLDRLVGRARQDRGIDVAPGLDDGAVGLHHRGNALVPALDDGPSRDLDHHRSPAHRRHRARSSFTTVTLS